jgi:hypothetical protein
MSAYGQSYYFFVLIINYTNGVLPLHVISTELQSI